MSTMGILNISIANMYDLQKKLILASRKIVPYMQYIFHTTYFYFFIFFFNLLLSRKKLKNVLNFIKYNKQTLQN